jgi:peptidoglycan/LPS O-acetylase OafA/YrhL
LNWAWVRQIGVYSFTIYLCHFGIILALDAHGMALGSWQLVLLSGGISVVYAALVHWWVELPIMGLRRRFAR